jgi:pimeloyl-ACP methyl ester carboxylesterase
MKRLHRAAWSVLVLLLLLLVVPMVIPVPPLKGTVPPEQLADPDSRFADVGGVRLHYKLGGEGQPTLVLLHGFGASIFSWREVFVPLARAGTVIATDRPASGLTSRPVSGQWQGPSPYSYESQADQTVELLDKLGVQRAVLVGNSAGGTVAVLMALRHPERVQALVLVDAAIYAGGTPAWVGPLLHIPQVRRWGPFFVRTISSNGINILHTAWHDPGRITPEIVAGYKKALQAQDWDRGLWELTLASHPLGLDKRLAQVLVPTLVITGDDDRIVPTAQSLRLARELPSAELVVIPNCGHLPQEEQPEAFLQAVNAFLARLPQEVP